MESEPRGVSLIFIGCLKETIDHMFSPIAKFNI